ncbi:unnamed protein product [Gordionus sp. m RMFG-2023]
MGDDISQVPVYPGMLYKSKNSPEQVLHHIHSNPEQDILSLNSDQQIIFDDLCYYLSVNALNHHRSPKNDLSILPVDLKIKLLSKPKVERKFIVSRYMNPENYANPSMHNIGEVNPATYLVSFLPPEHRKFTPLFWAVVCDLPCELIAFLVKECAAEPEQECFWDWGAACGWEGEKDRDKISFNAVIVRRINALNSSPTAFAVSNDNGIIQTSDPISASLNDDMNYDPDSGSSHSAQDLNDLNSIFDNVTFLDTNMSNNYSEDMENLNNQNNNASVHNFRNIQDEISDTYPSILDTIPVQPIGNFSAHLNYHITQNAYHEPMRDGSSNHNVLDFSRHQLVTPLWGAAVLGRILAARVLTRIGRARADTRSATTGSTALRSACFLTRHSVAAYLVEVCGANPWAVNHFGGTPLINSVQCPLLCEYLIRRCVTGGIARYKTKCGKDIGNNETALNSKEGEIDAYYHDYYDINMPPINLIIESKATNSLQESIDQSPDAKSRVIRTIFVNRADAQGKTALHYAAQEDHCASANVLMNYGANPGIRNRFGNDVWETCGLYGSTRVLNVLIRFDSNISNNGKTNFQDCCRCISNNTHLNFDNYNIPRHNEKGNIEMANSCNIIESNSAFINNLHSNYANVNRGIIENNHTFIPIVPEDQISRAYYLLGSTAIDENDDIPLAASFFHLGLQRREAIAYKILSSTQTPNKNLQVSSSTIKNLISSSHPKFHCLMPLNIQEFASSAELEAFMDGGGDMILPHLQTALLTERILGPWHEVTQNRLIRCAFKLLALGEYPAPCITLCIYALQSCLATCYDYYSYSKDITSNNTGLLRDYSPIIGTHSLFDDHTCWLITTLVKAVSEYENKYRVGYFHLNSPLSPTHTTNRASRISSQTLLTLISILFRSVISSMVSAFTGTDSYLCTLMASSSRTPYTSYIPTFQGPVCPSHRVNFNSILSSSLFLLYLTFLRVEPEFRSSLSFILQGGLPVFLPPDASTLVHHLADFLTPLRWEPEPNSFRRDHLHSFVDWLLTAWRPLAAHLHTTDYKGATFIHRLLSPIFVNFSIDSIDYCKSPYTISLLKMMIVNFGVHLDTPISLNWRLPHNVSSQSPKSDTQILNGAKTGQITRICNIIPFETIETGTVPPLTCLAARAINLSNNFSSITSLLPLGVAELIHIHNLVPLT